MSQTQGYPIAVERDAEGRPRIRADAAGEDHFDPATSFRLPPTSDRHMDRVGVVCCVLGKKLGWNQAREEGWFVAMPAGVYMSREGYVEFLSMHQAAIGRTH